MKLTPPPCAVADSRSSATPESARDNPPDIDADEAECRPLPDEAGMTTAEYAVGTLAAVAFAVVLMTVVRSGAVQSALSAVIEAALAMGR